MTPTRLKVQHTTLPSPTRLKVLSTFYQHFQYHFTPIFSELITSYAVPLIGACNDLWSAFRNVGKLVRNFFAGQYFETYLNYFNRWLN